MVMIFILFLSNILSKATFSNGGILIQSSIEDLFLFILNFLIRIIKLFSISKFPSVIPFSSIMAINSLLLISFNKILSNLFNSILLF